MNSTIIIGLLIPFLGTMLWSGFVFLMKNDMPAFAAIPQSLPRKPDVFV